MKSIEFIIKNYKSETIDGRDLHRLMEFIPEENLAEIGLELKEEYRGKHQHKPLTKGNILPLLEKDVAFAFEKALNQRGISAGMMFEVVRMWNWILEEGLEDWDEDNYAQYGLPLFKATALKYGFENLIGDDDGDESKYSSDY